MPTCSVTRGVGVSVHTCRSGHYAHIPVYEVGGHQDNRAYDKVKPTTAKSQMDDFSMEIKSENMQFCQD